MMSKSLVRVFWAIGVFAPALAPCAVVAPDEAREAVVGWATLGEALTGGAQFTASGIKGVETYGGGGRLGRVPCCIVEYLGGGDRLRETLDFPAFYGGCPLIS